MRKETPDFRLIVLAQSPPPLNKDAKEATLWTPFLRRGETIPIKVLAFRRDGCNGEIHLGVEGLPPGVVCSEGTVMADNASGLLFLSASENAENWSGPIRVIGKSKIAGEERVRDARAGSVTWNVPDYTIEPVRPRLIREMILAVSSAESAPVTLGPAENKVWEATVGGKCQIPLQLVRRGDFNENLKVKAMGVAGLDGLRELDIDGKTNFAALEIDLSQQKLSPGRYTFHLQAQTRGKYRDNPEAAKEADEAAKQAEKLAVDLTAQAKQTSDELAAASKTAEEAAAQARIAAEKLEVAKTAADATATSADMVAARETAEKEAEATAETAKSAVEAKAAAEKAARVASENVRDAEAKKTLAANRAKAADQRAKPRELTYTVYSVPITLLVKAEDKK